jgi:FkbM family methyltransferase
MTIHRKRFLQNAGWATAGAALGAFGRGWLHREEVIDSRPLPTQNPLNVSPRSTSPPPPANAEDRGDESFSQAGEDLAVRYFFQWRGIGEITYLDVGANDPIQLSNTYYFYRKGYHGVLVEPNVALCQRLREVRPLDTTLAAGVGVTAVKEADYYVMSEHGLSTFSKEEADRVTRASEGRHFVKEVIKMPLLNINDVMNEHFQGAPTFLSVDTEGLDLAILKSIDYARFRPKIICAETLIFGSARVLSEIPEFMATKGYVDRGGSIVNTIFVDSTIL